jgi:heme ABC exporter ATP-binding subunit CcmA
VHVTTPHDERDASGFDLRGVVALEGKFPVLAGATVSAASGTVTAVVGGNGAGKTSLLRTLGGLTAISRGTAHVLGHDITAQSNALIGRVGLVGHNTGLYDELSPADNLRLLATVTRRPRAAVMAALERVGLEGRLVTTPLLSLSAGQRRRASLAAMVLRDPELWLLDEPHASLDPEAQNTVDRLIAQALGSRSTVVFTSHDPDHARSIAHHVVEMAGGVVVAVTSGQRGIDDVA